MVTRQFVRVFGLNNSVHGCLDCLPRHRLSKGDAAKHPDTDDTDRQFTSWNTDG